MNKHLRRVCGDMQRPKNDGFVVSSDKYSLILPLSLRWNAQNAFECHPQRAEHVDDREEKEIEKFHIDTVKCVHLILRIS